MGLDWIAGHKPKPGHEDEFRKIVTTLFWDKLGKADRAAAQRGRWDRLARIFWPPSAAQGADDALKRRYDEIGIPALETLKAGRAGFDPAPNARAGTPPRDRLRFDVNADVERVAFGAQSLTGTTGIIGDHLLEACYEVKFAPDLSAFGRALIVRASAFAKARNLEVREGPSYEPDSPEGQLHSVTSAGRWCLFWGDRGHFLEPRF